MRHISYVLVAALSFAGVTASAQTGTSNSSRRANVVTRVVRASLRGITLTDAEKASLAKIAATANPKFTSRRDSAKPLRAKLVAARAAHDTSAARAARRELVALRHGGMTDLRSSLGQIRAALTPEHQATFDANAARVRRLIHARIAKRPLAPPR